MNGEKRQVSFRLDEEVAKEMKAAAATNEVSGDLGPFCQKLAEWAFGHYQKAKSLYQLRQCEVRFPRGGHKKNAVPRRSREITVR